MRTNKDIVADVCCIAGMIVAWTGYYLASDWAVAFTGSAFAAGMLLRAGALVFLTVYLAARKKLGAVFSGQRLCGIQHIVHGIRLIAADALYHSKQSIHIAGIGTEGLQIALQRLIQRFRQPILAEFICHHTAVKDALLQRIVEEFLIEHNHAFHV